MFLSEIPALRWTRPVLGNVFIVMWTPVAVVYFVFWRAQCRLEQSGFRRCCRCDYELAGLGDVGECPECKEPFDIARTKAEWTSTASGGDHRW